MICNSKASSSIRLTILADDSQLTFLRDLFTSPNLRRLRGAL